MYNKIFCAMLFSVKLTVVTVSYDIYSDTFSYMHISCNASEQKSFLRFIIFGNGLNIWKIRFKSDVQIFVKTRIFVNANIKFSHFFGMLPQLFS